MELKDKDIVIVGYARSAIGDFLGGLKDVSLIDLSTTVAKAAMERAGVKPEDVDELSMDKVNRNGSGSCLGHPVGMTGARIITACISEMLASGEHYGVASLCVGGGPAMATVLEIV